MMKKAVTKRSYTTLITVPIDPAFPTIGGIEAYSRNLLKYLSNSGINSILLGVSFTNITTTIDKVRFIPISRNRRISGYEYLFRLLIKTPFISIPESTIIYAQSPEFMLPFMFFHNKNPKLIHLHGNVLRANRAERLRIISFLYGLVESFVLKHANLVIAADNITKEYYQQEYPWIYKKIRVIPMAIDLSVFKLLERDCLRRQYGFKESDKVVMYLGRIAKEKNLGFLLRSFQFVLKSLPESELVFVGDGKDINNLQQLTKDLQLTRVQFMGAQEPNKVPEILNCADVLVLCSISEGSPNVVKEALACGVPVVSTSVGDLPTIIVNDKIGKIVDADEEKFAQAIIEILLNNQRESTRVECASVAANFNFDKTGAKITEIFRELC
jgi:L-malate glycosyltransferase